MFKRNKISKAKDIMSHNLISVNETASLKETIKVLSREALSGVPVVNQKNEVIGYISERDIIVAVFPESLKFKNPDVISLKELAPHIKKLSRSGAALVKDYMNETVYFVTEETGLPELLELMLSHNLKRLPVLRGRRLIGVIERSVVSKFSQESGEKK